MASSSAPGDGYGLKEEKQIALRHPRAARKYTVEDIKRRAQGRVAVQPSSPIYEPPPPPRSSTPEDEEAEPPSRVPPLLQYGPPPRDRTASFLASDVHCGYGAPIRLDPNWDGVKVEAMYLGGLDERAFGSFTVERDVKMMQGLLRLEEGKDGRDIAVSGYAFGGDKRGLPSPPIKIVFPVGSLARVYCAPVAGVASAGAPSLQVEAAVQADAGGQGDDERHYLIIETRWTPFFQTFVSDLRPSGPNATVRPTASIRLTAFDKLHARLAPFLSRHFLLVLRLPRDRSLPGEPPTVNSLADVLTSFSSRHRPDPIFLPQLLLATKKRYTGRKLDKLVQAFADVSPAVAYTLEGVLRDGTLAPSELVQLIREHVLPWTATPTAEYGEDVVEAILIELRTQLIEDRQLRKNALKTGVVTVLGLVDDPEWSWRLEDLAESARRVVVEGRRKADLERREKLESGFKVGAAQPEQQASGEHFYCRSIIFTPSRTIKVVGRVLEKSNSVIRKYYHPVDYHSESQYFLRVHFRDEDELALPANSGEAWHRLIDASVASVHKRGLRFAGRTYEFLAYSSSGLRERVVWFMAPWQVDQGGELKTITAADVRRDLGDFEKVSRQPAKLGSRYAQAFTASSATIYLHPHQIKAVPDISVLDKDGKEITNHTDGAGTMSVELRDEVWKSLLGSGFRRDKDAAPPSVFQLRLGGCKGIIVVDRYLKGSQVCLRPSQDKYKAFGDDEETGARYCLNVADAFTRPGSLRLNRPLISALNDLGVSTETFLNYQAMAVKDIAPVALETLYGAEVVLQKYTFGNATRFKSLLSSLQHFGIPDALLQQEPFLRAALNVIRARCLRSLKNKASIPLPDCYQLVGVPDEDSLLQPDQVYACLRFPERPHEPLYLEGRILITRSPVVDPGDLRIVNAIGRAPQGSRMEVLENCVVLPTTGERSLASMMGGGDVDGDRMDIITLADLMPARTVEPRSHQSLPPLELGHEATIEDVADCFVEYLREDSVGTIAVTHLILADKEPEHGLSPKCRALADLYSRAVDTPKTGNIVSRDEIHKIVRRPRLRPDFLRAADGDLPPGNVSYYESQRALGFLYRAIEDDDIKTPREVLLDIPNANPAVADSSSSSFRHIRLKVERQLAIAFDCSPDVLKDIVRDARQTLDPALATFTSQLADIATTHSLPRTRGRQLSEVEVFAVTSLLEADRHHAARGDAVASMARQVSALVAWLEGELREAVIQSATTEPRTLGTLELRYAAWAIARELDEWEFGQPSADPWGIDQQREKQYGANAPAFYDEPGGGEDDSDMDTTESDAADEYLAGLDRFLLNEASAKGRWEGQDEDCETDAEEDVTAEAAKLREQQLVKQKQREGTRSAERAAAMIAAAEPECKDTLEEARREEEETRARLRQEHERRAFLRDQPYERRAHIADAYQLQQQQSPGNGGATASAVSLALRPAPSTTSQDAKFSSPSTSPLFLPPHSTSATPPTVAWHASYSPWTLHPPVPATHAPIELAHPQPKRPHDSHLQHYDPNSTESIIAGDDFAYGAQRTVWESEELPRTSTIDEAPFFRPPHGHGHQYQKPSYQQHGDDDASFRPPPTPPRTKDYFGDSPNKPFWAYFDDYDKQRYKSGQSGLAKLGRLMQDPEGRSYRQVHGLGRDSQKWRRSEHRGGASPLRDDVPGSSSAVGGGWGAVGDVASGGAYDGAGGPVREWERSAAGEGLKGSGTAVHGGGWAASSATDGAAQGSGAVEGWLTGGSGIWGAPTSSWSGDRAAPSPAPPSHPFPFSPPDSPPSPPSTTFHSAQQLHNDPVTEPPHFSALDPSQQAYLSRPYSPTLPPPSPRSVPPLDSPSSPYSQQTPGNSGGALPGAWDPPSPSTRPEPLPTSHPRGSYASVAAPRPRKRGGSGGRKRGGRRGREPWPE
ncbi:hypothetical protein JCM10213v2_006021 [Rhodosporidiobolus nylandii]